MPLVDVLAWFHDPRGRACPSNGGLRLSAFSAIQLSDLTLRVRRRRLEIHLIPLAPGSSD